MPSEIHRLVADLSIAQIAHFFRERSYVARAECDQWAMSAIDEPVRASFVQGATSYTVEGERAVVQFRSAEDALDVQSIRHAQISYGSRFVPCPRKADSVFGLCVYVMDNVGGVSVYLARDQLRADDGHLLRVAVQDFAHFFAAPWHKPIPSMTLPDRSQLHARYKTDLEELQIGLPQRFRPLLDGLLEDLPSLFTPDWPMVHNHTDLLENNIHVDPETGHITGITTGWRWVHNSGDLRRVFWDAFTAALTGHDDENVPPPPPPPPLHHVKVARLVGIFLRFGFTWVDRETKRPLAEEDRGFSFLEAISLDVEVREPTPPFISSPSPTPQHTT